MSEVKAPTILETVTEKFPVEVTEVTCYRLANIWSELAQRHVREQMLYNYRKNRMLKVNGQGRVDRDVAISFLVKKLTK